MPSFLLPYLTLTQCLTIVGTARMSFIFCTYMENIRPKLYQVWIHFPDTLCPRGEKIKVIAGIEPWRHLYIGQTRAKLNTLVHQH